MNTSTSITSLSKDILLEILIRLPPKSAVRFRFVCKSFYSLIPEPQFSFTILFSVPTKTHYNRRLNLHTMSYSEESQAKLQAKRLQHLDVQAFQRRIDSSFAEGKICIISSIGEAGVYDLSTRQLISLPRIHPVDPIKGMINSDSNCVTLFTRAVLGFDSVSKIYKILKTELYYDRRSRDEVNRLWVLTVGVDKSWRNINPVIPGYLDDHLHIDGIIYLNHSGACSEIVAFDVGTESFELIPFPYQKYRVFIPRCSPWVNLNNRLAFIHIFKQELRAKINIWRLEKSKEWVKHVVPLPLEVSEIIGQAAPMEFTSNSVGEIVFFMQGRNMPPMILLYGFERQVWRKFEICGLHDYLYLHSYWERDYLPIVAHVIEERVYFSG